MEQDFSNSGGLIYILKTYTNINEKVIHLFWEQTACILLIGLHYKYLFFSDIKNSCDDGTLTVLKVSSELNFIKYDEVILIQN